MAEYYVKKTSFSLAPVGNPTDEACAALRSMDTDLMRHSTYELNATLEGQWGPYYLEVIWYPADSTLRFQMTPRQFPDVTRVEAVVALLQIIEVQMKLVQHQFCTLNRELSFCYGLLYSDHIAPCSGAIEDVLDYMMQEIDRVLPALQLVATGAAEVEDVATLADSVTLGHA